MAINKEYSITINNSVSEININVISITEDKLEIILKDHFDNMRKSNDWIGAIALSITLLIVLVTSEFKDKWLDAPTWKALFILLFIASLIYSGYCIYNAIVHRNTLKKLIQDIKKQETISEV